LHYLILVGHVDVLPKLFDRVMAPPGVVSEMSRPRTPAPVRLWVASRPQWLEVNAPTEVLKGARLGLGEREAISLAREMQAEAVLIDDRDAVKEARKHGLTVLGSLAILDEAAGRGFIPDLRETLERLVRETNFRMNRTTEAIIRSMLQRDSDRMHAEKQGAEQR
jgi:predicted nucleic acid-binding protein